MQSENCLALLWSTIKQQFDFRVTFLSINCDEQCSHLPGGTAAYPDINPIAVTRGRSLQISISPGDRRTLDSEDVPSRGVDQLQ